MIGEGIAEALPRLQAAAESLMVDSCTVSRGGSGEWVVDPETGYEVPDIGTEVYAGPCKVNTYQAFERAADVGGATEVIQRYYVHVPVSAGPFEVGDLIVVHSDARPDRTFRVAGLHEKTWQTAQRLLVDEGAP